MTWLVYPRVNNVSTAEIIAARSKRLTAVAELFLKSFIADKFLSLIVMSDIGELAEGPFCIVTEMLFLIIIVPTISYSSAFAL